MGMKTPPELWRCEECFTVHGDENDARECCPQSVTEGYGCPACGKFFCEEGAAMECCFEENSNPDVPPRLNPIELEAAGQQRLLG